MNNCVYTFDRRIIGTIDVTDYTSVYYGALIDIFKSYPEYFMTYEMAVDDKFENISYNLYGSEHYADIILVSNNNTFLWGGNYNSDVILEQIEAYRKVIINELNDDNENSTALLEVFDELDEKLVNNNSKRRILTVPIPEKLNAILSIVDNYREKNRIPDITESS